jgi:hypothetical protein
MKMDAVTEIKIDRDVPLAPRGNSRVSKYPFADMNIGDSFLFPSHRKVTAAGAVCAYARKRTGFKFATRTTPEGVRCWRIA